MEKMPHIYLAFDGAEAFPRDRRGWRGDRIEADFVLIRRLLLLFPVEIWGLR